MINVVLDKVARRKISSLKGFLASAERIAEVSASRTWLLIDRSFFVKEGGADIISPQFSVFCIEMD